MRLVAQAHQLAALLVGADEQRQVVRCGAVELPGQAGQAVSVARVGAQEDGHAVGLAGRDASQQPGRRLRALEGRQQLAEDVVLAGGAAGPPTLSP